MNQELEKLASNYITQVESQSVVLGTIDKERIKYLVELAALQGVIDYQKEQIGAFKK